MSLREAGLRRSSRRSAALQAVLGEFNEPSLASESRLNLKTTGQNLSEFPDADALTAIEDPGRVNRQKTQNAPKVHRRIHRLAIEDNRSGQMSNGEDSDSSKLLLKLKRSLAPKPKTTYSSIRETPFKGVEDYRHNRDDPDESGRSKRRKHFGREPSAEDRKRPKRSTRVSSASHYKHENNSNTEKKAKATKVENNKVYESAKSSKVEKVDNAKKKKCGDCPEDFSTETVKENKKEIVNNDYCNSCGGTGELLCCEMCVRSFHFSCIQPPVMNVDEIQEEVWACRSCKPVEYTEQEKKQWSDTFFAPLIMSAASTNAMAYQLPTHLREMFVNISTNKYGEYEDPLMRTVLAQPGPRIQDKDCNYLLCFKCKGSGLNQKELAVCSKCDEPWHIDCVDPPLESTPLGYWVCPLHAGRSTELPKRVKDPIITTTLLKRQIKNDGDIEIDDEDDEDVNLSAEDVKDVKDSDDNDHTRVEDPIEPEGCGRQSAGVYDEEVVNKNLHFPAQTRVMPDGLIAARVARHRPRGFESDRVVYKIPSRTIKLDFLDAVQMRRQEPLRETPTSEFMRALDLLAERPQKDCEAVRNLLSLKLTGPAVSTAVAKNNLKTLIDAALDDENELGQIAAIRKLMQEKGKERLLQALESL